MKILYRITHIASGRQYIGSTSNFRKRMWTHCRGKRVRHSEIDRAIQKFGKAAFEFFAIESCPDEEADARECYLIKKFKTLHPNGYNMNTGGRRVFRMAAAAAARISEVKTGKKTKRVYVRGAYHHTPEAKAKISAAVSLRYKKQEARRNDR